MRYKNTQLESIGLCIVLYFLYDSMTIFQEFSQHVSDITVSKI